jgi:hypothetical protein
MVAKKSASLILVAILIFSLLPFPEQVFALTCGTGSNITFTDIGTGQCRGYIVATGNSSFTVPSNWSNTNLIEVIGGGGGGARPKLNNEEASGGGGGACKAIRSPRRR